MGCCTMRSWSVVAVVVAALIMFFQYPFRRWSLKKAAFYPNPTSYSFRYDEALAQDPGSLWWYNVWLSDSRHNDAFTLWTSTGFAHERNAAAGLYHVRADGRRSPNVESPLLIEYLYVNKSNPEQTAAYGSLPVYNCRLQTGDLLMIGYDRPAALEDARDQTFAFNELSGHIMAHSSDYTTATTASDPCDGDTGTSLGDRADPLADLTTVGQVQPVALFFSDGDHKSGRYIHHAGSEVDVDLRLSRQNGADNGRLAEAMAAEGEPALGSSYAYLSGTVRGHVRMLNAAIDRTFDGESTVRAYGGSTRGWQPNDPQVPGAFDDIEWAWMWADFPDFFALAPDTPPVPAGSDFDRTGATPDDFVRLFRQAVDGIPAEAAPSAMKVSLAPYASFAERLQDATAGSFNGAADLNVGVRFSGVHNQSQAPLIEGMSPSVDLPLLNRQMQDAVTPDLSLMLAYVRKGPVMIATAAVGVYDATGGFSSIGVPLGVMNLPVLVPSNVGAVSLCSLHMSDFTPWQSETDLSDASDRSYSSNSCYGKSTQVPQWWRFRYATERLKVDVDVHIDDPQALHNMQVAEMDGLCYLRGGKATVHAHISVAAPERQDGWVSVQASTDRHVLLEWLTPQDKPDMETDVWSV